MQTAIRPLCLCFDNTIHFLWYYSRFIDRAEQAIIVFIETDVCVTSGICQTSFSSVIPFVGAFINFPPKEIDARGG